MEKISANTLNTFHSYRRNGKGDDEMYLYVQTMEEAGTEICIYKSNYATDTLSMEYPR